nr:hypothetical protein [Chroococcidiopsis cubana]
MLCPIPVDSSGFLEDEKAIASRWQKIVGRGRPRRMYQVNPQWLGRCTKANRRVDE